MFVPLTTAAACRTFQRMSRPRSRSDGGAIYKAVGEKIRRARGDRKQAAVASQVGLTRSSITNIELGRQKVLLHTFVDIALALGVNPADLLPDLPKVGPVELPSSLAPAERQFVQRGLAVASPKLRR